MISGALTLVMMVVGGIFLLGFVAILGDQFQAYLRHRAQMRGAGQDAQALAQRVAALEAELREVRDLANRQAIQLDDWSRLGASAPAVAPRSEGDVVRPR